MSDTWKVRTPKFERIISSVPATKAMENMPACSAPTSWVHTMVSSGKTMPQMLVPTVFQM